MRKVGLPLLREARRSAALAGPEVLLSLLPVKILIIIPAFPRLTMRV